LQSESYRMHLGFRELCGWDKMLRSASTNRGVTLTVIDIWIGMKVAN